MKKILAFLFVFVGLPVGTIWSLNMLFGLQIPFNWRTWFATMILLTVVVTILYPLRPKNDERNRKDSSTSL